MTNFFSVCSSKSLAMALAFGAAVVAGSFALDARAQTADPRQQQAPGAQQEAFSEQELKSYAEATVEVQEIGKKYQSQVQAADDPAKAAQYQQQAQQEMVEAVQEKGLSVEQYNSIYTAAQADQALQEKILAYMQQAR